MYIVQVHVMLDTPIAILPELGASVMFFYLIRFAVNAVAVALTAWLLPGIVVVHDNIWTYLWLALGLALINALIRPVVLLFTGQLIIATMGLMILVINAIMLYLLTI